MKEFLKQLAQRNQFLKKESIDIYIDRVSYLKLKHLWNTIKIMRAIIMAEITVVRHFIP